MSWERAHEWFGDALSLTIPATTVDLAVHKMPSNGFLFSPNERRFIMDGDWDLECAALSEKATYMEMRDLLSAGANYRSIASYRHRISQVDLGKPTKHRRTRLDSIDAVEEYFQRYLMIAESMRLDGFRSNRDLGCPDKSEIGVAVRRDGSLVHFHTGNHRMAISHILGLKEITVEVKMVHFQWLMKALLKGDSGGRLWPPRLPSIEQFPPY